MDPEDLQGSVEFEDRKKKDQSETYDKNEKKSDSVKKEAKEPLQERPDVDKGKR